MTAQRHAEADREQLLRELRKTTATLQALIDSMRAGVVFCDETGKITLTNPAALHMFAGRSLATPSGHMAAIR